MSGETDLRQLLAGLKPILGEPILVVCSIPDGVYGDFSELNPVASITESEGLTIVITKQAAQSHCLEYDGCFRKLTLTVHSSLHAVGLTAAVSTALAEHGISANLLAGAFHDHILVPEDRALDALAICHTIAERASMVPGSQ